MKINVRAVANRTIQPVNPNITALLRRSSGVTTNAAGKRASATRDFPVEIQSQPITSDEAKLIEAANIAGTFRAVHLFGNYEGLKRYNEQGADLLNFKQHDDSGEAKDWQIIQVMESWPNWCRLLLCRQ